MSSTATTPIPNWNMKSDYVETCNCDYGCPCNFSTFPTYGFCRALVLYRIKEGNYGDNIDLNGLEVIMQFPGLKQSTKEMELCNYSLQKIQTKIKDKQS